MTAARREHDAPSPAMVRILRAFRDRPGRIDEDAVRFDDGALRMLPIASDQRDQLLAGPWLAVADDGRASLTAAGRAALADSAVTQSATGGGDRPAVTVAPVPLPSVGGRAESPLAWLATRRDRDGSAFLCPDAVAAGERLRLDYERGQEGPGLVSNWRCHDRVDGGGGDRGGSEDHHSRMQAARGRVERALDAVGAHLGGVLVDVCCLLKGLEQVERERGWPARAAKVVLRLALERLVEHYHQPRRTRAPMVHWGATDYRPTHDATRHRGAS